MSKLQIKQYQNTKNILKKIKLQTNYFTLKIFQIMIFLGFILNNNIITICQQLRELLIQILNNC